MSKSRAYFSITYYIRPSPKSKYAENLFQSKKIFLQNLTLLSAERRLIFSDESYSVTKVNQNLSYKLIMFLSSSHPYGNSHFQEVLQLNGTSHIHQDRQCFCYTFHIRQDFPNHHHF